jgi:hypothetical protein
MFGHRRPTSSYHPRRWNCRGAAQSLSTFTRSRNGLYGAHRMQCASCWHEMSEETNRFAGQLVRTMRHSGVRSGRVASDAEVRNIAEGISAWGPASLPAAHSVGSPSKVA